MRKNYKKLSLFCLSAMLSVAAVAVTDSNEANLGTMRGRIVDNSNQVLPGATVMIESLHTGVVSDANGFYTIPNLKPGVYTVKVSYVGYQRQRLN